MDAGGQEPGRALFADGNWERYRVREVAELLVGILLTGILALRSIELADRLSADFKHPVLDAVLLVFTGAAGTLNEHERAFGHENR